MTVIHHKVLVSYVEVCRIISYAYSLILTYVGPCIEGDVRLVAAAGFDRFDDFVSGEVQTCLNDVFGSVCDDSWGNTDASVVCQQLGFSPHGDLLCFSFVVVVICSVPLLAGAIGGRGGAETSNTVLTMVDCMGNESTIQDCSSIETTECTSQEIATVICQGTYIHMYIRILLCA